MQEKVFQDERNQVLTTRSWLNVNWFDPRLTWNASEWDGISTLYIPYQRLWKPDIILVNSAVRQYYEAIVSTDIMTTSSGNVTWLFSAIFKSSCQIKVRYYPFDDQILPCVLISSMAVLGFFMPPQTGEKINMCITTILSMGVYLQSIMESIPPTSEAVPLIGMYYVSSLFMSIMESIPPTSEAVPLIGEFPTF
ncbi:unnamed protein product [Gongylonema pulchrum]|uniref:Neurotransmitter-gated ion-channel ligand-binding domain-containing protein n=1 Tax=Gongylonema pulchrum TaxID=637853 RepID=A0A3P7PZZ2_9BILA|nr:unnamed protein product [Gongylonema pulchrum]